MLSNHLAMPEMAYFQQQILSGFPLFQFTPIETLQLMGGACNANT